MGDARRPAAPAGREFAPAKINLALHILGRRADGYHDLDTLAVFADVGDVVTAAPFPGDLELTIDGPFAAPLVSGAAPDNLVLRAARAMSAAFGTDRPGLAFGLTKNLPVAAGLGGGSADAAAVLRLLAAAWSIDRADLALGAIALALGADVPMCLASRPLIARGRGEILSPLGGVPALSVVLVHPGVPVSTAAIFARRRGPFDLPLPAAPASFGSAEAMAGWLRGSGNGLAPAAREAAPAIGAALEALTAAPRSLLSRMSGSGSTCFGIFPTDAAAADAARTIRTAEPGWWVAATTTGASP